MLQNILNFEGVTLLSKTEQSNLLGGSQTCRLTIRRANGTVGTIEFDNYSDGELGSSQANQDCVTIMGSGLGHQSCHYDCEYDGFGQ
jgi:hypothetical protein